MDGLGGLSFEPLLRHRWVVIAAFVLLTLAAAPGALHLEVDNSPEGFFVEDARALTHFRKLEHTFGRDRGVRLVLTGTGLWTPRGLAWLASLEEAAQSLGGVWAAGGPLAHHRWHLEQWPPVDPEMFRALLLGDPVDHEAGWVSRDSSTVTVLVALYKMSPQRRAATLAELEALLARAPPGIIGHVVGLAVVNRALDQAQREMATYVFPLLLGVALALLIVLFRSVSGVVLPLSFVAICLIVLLGAIGYTGQRFDIVTCLLVPLVGVISLATAVHVLAYHRRLRSTGLDPFAATIATYRVKAWPVLWTGMTTCVGFASLAFAGVPSVRALGLWTAFATAFLTLVALSLYPAVLSIVGRSDRLPWLGVGTWLAARGAAWAAIAVRRRRMVLCLFGVAALAATAGLPRLFIETNILTYFRPSHPVRTEVHRLEDKGVGVVAASLVMENGSFEDPASLRRIARLGTALRDDPLVLGVLGPTDLVEDVARYGPAPAAGEDPLGAAQAQIAQLPGPRRFLALLSRPSKQCARLILFTRMRGYTELEPVYRRAEEMARRVLPGVRVWITGQYPLVLEAQRSLLATIVLSLTVTFLVIGLILRLLLRSNALAWRALVPNVWPVLVILGAMGWLSIPLDSATVMIAAVALCLAVDDTLHTLGHFRRTVGRSVSDADRVAEVIATLKQTAPGHIGTSAILALGFGGCGLSSLVPVARFGGLSALAICAALAADLFLVPVLLAYAPKRAVQQFCSSE